MATLMINKRKVRAFALEVSARERRGRFTRVGAEFYLLCEDSLRAVILGHVKRLPSKGKTIK